jgi:hypothetical protein
LAIFLQILQCSLQSQIIITELMASSDENYRDSDGAPSDWIEITNNGDSEASLEGCYLTNNNDDPTRWTFPQTKIPAGNSIVIFASGKDRKDTNELHTSFTLDRGGDYLGLIGPDGVTVLSEVAPNYPQQYENISYGIGMANGAKSLSLVKFGSNVKYFITDTDAFDNDWKKAPSLFNDSSWTEALSPLGFESSGGILEDSIATNIKDEMRGTNASGFFRYPFTFDSNSKQVTSLELKVIIDDGFVAYLNGVEVGSFGKPSPFLWNSSSTKSRSDNIVKSTPIIIDLTSHRSALIDGNNVLAIQGMNQSRSSSDFIIDAELSAQFRDTSAGIQYGHFINPTPGKPNDTVLNGPPQEITFSKQSCMFTQSFEIRLSTTTPGAIIRYTTDLSVPSNEKNDPSRQFTDPIIINESTQIRAQAFLPGSIDGKVRTESYLKMSQSIPEFSSNLPIIVISTLGKGSPPSTSSTTRREAYMFFFEPDPETGRTVLTQSPQLTTRAGIRRRGSSSGYWPKYSLSIETWKDGNDDDRNIEPLGMAREADWILNARYEWDLALMRNPFVYEISRQIGRYAPHTQFVEVFSDTSGNSVTDNDYFGVYSLIERIEMDPNRVDIEHLQPWENSEPEITGGYIFKNDRPDPGEPTMYVNGMGQLTYVDPGGLQLTSQQRSWITRHLNELNSALINKPSGINRSTGLHFSDYIDVDSWIDHHWLNILVMNIDWGRHSAFFHKDRGGKIVSGPVWDFDRALGCEDVRDNNPLAWEGVVNSVGTVSSKTWYDSRFPWYGNLLGPSADPAKTNYPDIRQRHTDRWFELRKGVFSISNLHSIIDSMADKIRESQARNFQRWRQIPPNGGQFSDPELSGWEAEISHMKNWLEARASWVDEQYPKQPAFNSSSGIVSPGFGLTMNSADGQVIYTTDGSDPRSSGGEPSTKSQIFPGGPINEIILAPDSPCRYIVPKNDQLRLDWAENLDNFDDSEWTNAINGIGFESVGGISELINTDIKDLMKGINASCYVRYEFEFDNADNVNDILLTVWPDDGFIAYFNGIKVGSLLAPDPPSWNSRTENGRSRPGGDSAVLRSPIEIDITPFKNHIRNGSNVLAMHGMNSSQGGSDFLIRTTLEINHNVSAEPLLINDTQLITARTYNGSTWSAPEKITLIGSDNIADSTNLVISEIMYRPHGPTEDEISAGHNDRDLFEYLELLNIGNSPVNLLGLKFNDGIDFDFSKSPLALLLPNERILLVRNTEAFNFRYGSQFSDRIAGEFLNSTGLSNGGESLTLLSSADEILLTVKYSDTDPWPVSADTDGHSLVLIEPNSYPNHELASNWRSSSSVGGTPGHSDNVSYIDWAANFGNPDPNSDLDSDDKTALLEFANGTDPTVPTTSKDTATALLDSSGALTVSFKRSLTSKGLSFIIETSNDLIVWKSDTKNWQYSGEKNLDDGTAIVSFLCIIDDYPQYVRQRINLK